MKKGFTLIELLAVIVVLTIIMVFAIPAITNTGSNAMHKINSVEEKNLKEVGKMIALDLDDQDSDIYNCSGWISKCSKNGINWTTVIISIEELINHNYFNDKDGHLTEYSITISKVHNDYNISINKN